MSEASFSKDDVEHVFGRALRPGLPPLPQRMRNLPLDHRGFPVPWFVAWVDGAPDFRVIGPGKIVEAVNGQKCWLCGQRLGAFKTFVIGPMCAVNRISSEPPSHLDCAEFAAKACPFLTQPRMRRNEKDLPEEGVNPAGIPIKRNPGVALVWVTRSFKVEKHPRPSGEGALFRVGDPTAVHWYAEGRDATRDEVIASINSGLPLLYDQCEREIGPLKREAARRELHRLMEVALKLVPEAV